MRAVARGAGTSVATNSHVLNETLFVSPEVPARVEDALSSLGYRPDDVVPDNSNPYPDEQRELGLVVGSSTGPASASGGEGAMS